MKNSEKVKYLEQDEAFIWYYHVSESNKLPAYIKAATVCLIHTESVIIRGVAFCSKKDVFDGEVGREKALGRAIQALELRRNVVSKGDFPIIKGFYQVKLTWFEKIILSMYRRHEAGAVRCVIVC